MPYAWKSCKNFLGVTNTPSPTIFLSLFQNLIIYTGPAEVCTNSAAMSCALSQNNAATSMAASILVHEVRELI